MGSGLGSGFGGPLTASEQVVSLRGALGSGGSAVLFSRSAPMHWVRVRARARVRVRVRVRDRVRVSF